MSMNVGNSEEGGVMIDVNLTPLIDVLLVLLTLLIITLPIQTNAVKLDMPRPNQAPPLVPPQTVDLVVDFDGTVIWNGTPVDAPTLRSYFKNAAIQVPQPEIHLDPNRLAKYDDVARVLAEAQRMGVTHIGFIGINQYSQ